MEIDVKKIFYIIVAIAAISIITTSIVSPIYKKAKAQREEIEKIDFQSSSITGKAVVESEFIIA